MEGRTSMMSVAWIREVLGLKPNSPAPALVSPPAAPAALVPEAGLVLGGRYRLEQRLGQGSVSVVFRGRDQMLELGVAIKILTFPEGGGLRPSAADLRAEAKAAMRLAHPNIVRVYHVDIDRGLEYLVMELVDGEDLGRLRARYPGHRLPLAVVVKAGLGLLSALDHAHSLGVIHNDIKPANLLLDVDGTIKLCDLAFARMTERSAPPGTLVGVPAYTAPERILGQAGSARSDLYSTAATLFALAVGRPPYGREARAAAEGHLHGTLPHSPAVPPRLDAILRKAMSRDPFARYPSAMAMRADLLRFADELDHTVQIQPSSPRPVVPDELPTSPSIDKLLTRSALTGLPERVEPAAPALPTGPTLVPLASGPTLVPLTALHLAAPSPVIPSPPTPSPPTPSPPTPPVVLVEEAPAALPPADMALVEGRLVQINGRDVEVEPFLLDREPVTNAAYRRFIEESGEPPPQHWLGRRPPAGKDDHPVVGVTFAAAQRFARAMGRRLPTEAEWISAARGPLGTPFPWGDVCEPSHCQCTRSGAQDTAPVSAHAQGATPEGIRDLLGQVWEWVEHDPRLPAPEAGRSIALGGSFRHPCQTAGVVPRTEIATHNHYLYLGFRCAAECP